MEIFLGFLLTLGFSVSLLLFQISINSQIANEEHRFALYFDPNCKKGKQSRRIMKEKFKEAKSYEKLSIWLPTSPAKVLEIIRKHNPKSIINPSGYPALQNNETVKHSSTDFMSRVFENTQAFVKDTKEGNILIPSSYNMPSFKYMPEPTKSGTLMIESKVCDGCNLEQPLYFEVSGANDFCFCPQCLFNGQAKQKASDYFNDSDYILEGDKKVSKPRYLEEFQYHTPQFFSWQDNIWLTHCDDFCSYLGIVYWSDIQKLGKEVEAQIIADFKQSKQDFSIASIKKNLQEDSEMVGHLFQCCHCKKFRLYIELS